MMPVALFFDAIIFSFLILSGAILIHIWHHWGRFRRKKLAALFAVVLSIGWGVVFYGSFIESNILTTRETSIVLPSANPDASETIRVALISDLHLGPYHGEEWAQKVVVAIQKEHPDLIFLAGDFVAGLPEEAEGLAPLKDLSARYGVFAVTGNHEYEHGAASAVIAALERDGITVLQNASKEIVVGEKTFTLVGISDIWYADDLPKALEGVSDVNPLVLLTHNPDTEFLPEAARADLVIAGHTHGGQIRLPWIGAIGSIPDKLGRAYDRGLFPYGTGQLFVTSGVGTSGPRARLFNPPVIDVLTLTF